MHYYSTLLDRRMLIYITIKFPLMRFNRYFQYKHNITCQDEMRTVDPRTASAQDWSYFCCPWCPRHQPGFYLCLTLEVPRVFYHFSFHDYHWTPHWHFRYFDWQLARPENEETFFIICLSNISNPMPLIVSFGWNWSRLVLLDKSMYCKCIIFA